MTVRMTLMPPDGDPNDFLAALGLAERMEMRSTGAIRERRSRFVTKSSHACPACSANSDPDRVPLHPGCHCGIGGDTPWETMRGRTLAGSLVRALDDLGLREMWREAAEQVDWLDTLDPDAAGAVRAWFAGDRADILDGWTEGGPMTEAAQAFRRGVEGQPGPGTVVYAPGELLRPGQILGVTDKPLAVQLDPAAVSSNVVYEIAGRAHALDGMEAVVLPGHEYIVDSVTEAPVAGVLSTVVRLTQTVL